MKKRTIPIQVRMEVDVIKVIDGLIVKKEFDTRAQFIRKGANELLKKYEEKILA